MSEVREADEPPARPQGYYAGTTDQPAVYVLEGVRDKYGRVKPGTYVLVRQITYVTAAGDAWMVPAEEGQRFETDLASIPSLASWLVPKDGTHTPAALIHDAMIVKEGEAPCHDPADPVHPEEADRIFREGMQHLGVHLLRRWMMWTAVSLRTFALPYGHHWVRRLLYAGLVAFAVVGVFGMLDVVDMPVGTLPGWVPRLGGRPAAWHLVGIPEAGLLRELGHFLAIAGVGSVLYAAVWLRRWRFGLIAGLSLSLLAVPMAVPAIAFGAYRVLEEAVALVLLGLRRFGRRTGRVRAAEWVQTIDRRVLKPLAPSRAAPDGTPPPGEGGGAP